MRYTINTHIPRYAELWQEEELTFYWYWVDFWCAHLVIGFTVIYYYKSTVVSVGMVNTWFMCYVMALVH